jgi:hypothetical protein
MGGSLPYVSGLITDRAGNLYAGGFFATAGGVTVNGVAKWNGSAWSAFGSGISGANANVNAFAFDHAGNVYIGGSFTTAGGAPASCVAKWNGTNWSALGSGITGGSFPYVNSMAMDSNDRLYVGGQSTNAGGITANYIAVWDGTNWSAMGAGMNSYVYSLAFDAAHNLYVGGGFSTADGNPANGIARWDGTGWSALGSGLNSAVIALAPDGAGRLYAAGWFTAAGTNVSAFVAQANILPTISKPRRNPDGSLTFNLLTTPQTSSRVLATTNLAPPVVWQPIYTNVAPANGAWQFTDTNTARYRFQFYRSSTP